jgi:hypothetical protein
VRYTQFAIKVSNKHNYKLGTKYFYKSSIKNLATVQIFGVTSDKYNVVQDKILGTRRTKKGFFPRKKREMSITIIITIKLTMACNIFIIPNMYVLWFVCDSIVSPIVFQCTTITQELNCVTLIGYEFSLLNFVFNNSRRSCHG